MQNQSDSKAKNGLAQVDSIVARVVTFDTISKLPSLATRVVFVILSCVSSPLLAAPADEAIQIRLPTDTPTADSRSASTQLLQQLQLILGAPKLVGIEAAMVGDEKSKWTFELMGPELVIRNTWNRFDLRVNVIEDALRFATAESPAYLATEFLTALQPRTTSFRPGQGRYANRPNGSATPNTPITAAKPTTYVRVGLKLSYGGPYILVEMDVLRSSDPEGNKPLARPQRFNYYLQKIE